MRDFVFDMDGTLYDSCTVEIDAFQGALAEAGFPVPDAETVMENVGPPFEVMIANLAQNDDPRVVAELRKVVVRWETAVIRRQATLYEGIGPMLRELKGRGAGLYICSNGNVEYLEELCKKFAFDELFDDIWRTRPGVGKPEALRILRDRNGLKDFAMIGDLNFDIEAGKAARSDYDRGNLRFFRPGIGAGRGSGLQNGGGVAGVPNGIDGVAKPKV